MHLYWPPDSSTRYLTGISNVAGSRHELLMSAPSTCSTLDFFSVTGTSIHLVTHPKHWTLLLLLPLTCKPVAILSAPPSSWPALLSSIAPSRRKATVLKTGTVDMYHFTALPQTLCGIPHILRMLTSKPLTVADRCLQSVRSTLPNPQQRELTWAYHNGILSNRASFQVRGSDRKRLA